MTRRVLVTGSREWKDYETIARALDEAAPTELAHGGAPGADSLADRWGSENGVPARAYDANWSAYGKKAGFVRNQEMLDAFQPHLVIAFKDGFDYEMKSGGTEHMVKIAAEAGYEVKIIDRFKQQMGLFDDA